MTPEQRKRVEEIRKDYPKRPGSITMSAASSNVYFLLDIIDQLAVESRTLRELGSVVVAENKYEAMAIFRKRHERANCWKIYEPDPYSPNTEAIYRFMWLPTSQAKRIEEIANGPPSIEALREIERMANEEFNQREDGLDKEK